jgi:hypothetical protein
MHDLLAKKRAFSDHRGVVEKQESTKKAGGNRGAERKQHDFF